MPDGYEDMRLHLATSGIAHENLADIYRTKVAVVGGMNYISADNVNKANTRRSDNLMEFIKDTYPYIKVQEDEPTSAPSTTEDMIEAYHQLFGSHK